MKTLTRDLLTFIVFLTKGRIVNAIKLGTMNRKRAIWMYYFVQTPNIMKECMKTTIGKNVVLHVTSVDFLLLFAQYQRTGLKEEVFTWLTRSSRQSFPD